MLLCYLKYFLEAIFQTCLHKGSIPYLLFLKKNLDESLPSFMQVYLQDMDFFRQISLDYDTISTIYLLYDLWAP